MADRLRRDVGHRGAVARLPPLRPAPCRGRLPAPRAALRGCVTPVPERRQPKPVSILVRVGVACAYGAVVLAAVLWGGVAGVAALYAVVATVSVVEFYEITRREHRTPNELFGAIAVAAMPIAAAVADLKGLATVAAVLIVAALLWHLLFARVRTSDTATTVFGAVYVGFTLSHLVLLRRLPLA
ncbi:MAG: hypothetical protein FDZ70_08880, partial [Actinobacteria bacterium]